MRIAQRFRSSRSARRLALVLAMCLPAVMGPCATFGSPAAASRALPATSGVSGYSFPLAGCRVTYGRTHHDYPATDMFAPRGCRFVSPRSGVVDEVSRVDRWSSATDRGADRGGLFVSIVGDDGVRYYGSHLQYVATGIKRGVHVKRGQLLGRVGNSGSARGVSPHLHFGLSWPTRTGIWWVRRGMVPPWWFLDGWRAGISRSPRTAVARARIRAGSAVPRCTSYC